jgi:hypothetical protein
MRRCLEARFLGAILIWAVSSSLVLFPARASSQVISGRLVDASSHASIAYGRLELFDATGRMIAAVQSSGSGAFVLTAPRPGRYRYRGAAIGYELAPLAEIAIESAEVTLGEVLLTRAAAKLPDLVASSHPTLKWTSHFYRLWDSNTGDCVAVVAYQVDFRNLIVSASGPSRTASIRLALHQGNTGNTHGTDTTVTLRLVVPNESGAESKYSGFFAAPSAGDFTSWTLIITQPENRTGADWEELRPALATGPLAISDLVIGTPRQGLEWVDGGHRVLISAVEPIDVRDSIHVFFQIKSSDVRSALHNEIIVYHADQVEHTPIPVLRLPFDIGVTAGINAVERTLDLSRLNSGRYRLEVHVGNPVTKATATQYVNVYLE